jgi:hypothetical protein
MLAKSAKTAPSTPGLIKISYLRQFITNLGALGPWRPWRESPGRIALIKPVLIATMAAFLPVKAAAAIDAC